MKNLLKGRKRKFIWGLIIGLGVVPVIMLAALYKYSTSPSFCGNCHIMDPYVDAWKTSSHSFVKCVECHYPPGTRDTLYAKYQAISQVVKYVTKTYGSKPYAQIEDSSCLREGCHQTRLLEGLVDFKRGIHFDHKPHLSSPKRGRQLRCTSCHSQIVVGNHITVTESACFLCHFKGMKSGRTENPIAGCPSCHQPPDYDIKFSNITYNHRDFVGARGVECEKCHLDAIGGDGNAPKERCFVCHNEPERVEKYAEVIFIHDTHVTDHDVACMQCHEEIKHAVKTTVEPLQYDCSACHENKHTGVAELYRGEGGIGVEPYPSPMYLARVECISCHTEMKFEGSEMLYKGQTYLPSGKGCVKCHGSEYEGIFDTWKQEIDKSLAETKVHLEKAESLLASSSGDASEEVKKLVGDSRHNYELIRIAKGIHNFDYSLTVLAKATEDSKKTIEILGVKEAGAGKDENQ